MNKPNDELSNWQINQINETLKSVQIINSTLSNSGLDSEHTNKLRKIREKVISHMHFVGLYDFIEDGD